MARRHSMKTALGFVLFVSVVVLPGCRSNPGEWSRERIEKWLKEEQKLKDLRLRQNEDGTFTGDGVTESGDKVTFKLKQDKEERKLDYWILDEAGKPKLHKVFRTF